MEMLWTKDLKINTVHVRDVCKALWFLTTHGNSGQIFNLADSNDTGSLFIRLSSLVFDLLKDSILSS